ncbi:MAG TPA: magnesium/cobalt transporter CorA [Streptosporangiaceae bacterium]|nr:magnesium/cobalt transporter CorA [Streptosporangiaceae bacterium]
MTGFLIENDGSSASADRETVQRLLDKGELLWFDLYRPDADELGMLATVFGIHQLALEDAAQFGQRPKLEDYDDFTQLIAFGVDEGSDDLVEVHFFYSTRYLVTVRHGDCAAFAEVRNRLAHRAKPVSRLLLLHHILDELTDGFFPVLSSFDDRIDQLQDEIFAKPTDQQLSELFNRKRWLIGVRKVITPQRDLVASLVDGVAELPGMTREIERYFRDLYDHLIRVSDLVDSYRDLLTDSMDAYLSTVSNRLNVVMKQLTVIATIFLPLAFLTGFFGQNFSWMVVRLGGLGPFLVLGLGSELAVVVAMLIVFRRRGWV